MKRIALFGSYARDTQISGESDIDLLVEVDPSIGLGFVTLANRLEQLLGTRVESRLAPCDQTVIVEADRAGTNRCLSETPNSCWRTSARRPLAPYATRAECNAIPGRREDNRRGRTQSGDHRRSRALAARRPEAST
ncbi:MAG: nucleotidyltransferase domain-containing protein [Chthoniobacterales bacterium]|nr:nucleotidyltransferase domain-containing protein [Chthoniobacterales bacterium]